MKSPITPVSNPWIAVDLDGTIMEDGCYPGFGKPRKDAKKILCEYRKMGIKIMIYTVRMNSTNEFGDFVNTNKTMDRIRSWCAQHEIPCDYIFSFFKPSWVLAFFDDRNIFVPPEEDGWEKASKNFLGRYEDTIKRFSSSGDMTKAGMKEFFVIDIEEKPTVPVDVENDWIDALKEVPLVEEKSKESDYVLCLKGGPDSKPFTGWWSERMNVWYDADPLAPSVAIFVKWWKPMIALPEGR